MNIHEKSSLGRFHLIRRSSDLVKSYVIVRKRR